MVLLIGVDVRANGELRSYGGSGSLRGDDGDVATECVDAVAQPDQSEVLLVPRTRLGNAADAVIGDGQGQCVGQLDEHLDVRGSRVLECIGDGLGGDEVRGRLDALIQPSGEVADRRRPVSGSVSRAP